MKFDSTRPRATPARAAATGRRPPVVHASDLQGAIRLAIEAVLGVTDIAEAVHRSMLDEGLLPGETGPRQVPLPRGVRCHAIAASRQARAPREGGVRVQGDGLVPVGSALGEHDDPALRLHLRAARKWVGYGMNHFHLLSRPDVFERLFRWLAKLSLTRKQSARYPGLWDCPAPIH